MGPAHLGSIVAVSFVLLINSATAQTTVSKLDAYLNQAHAAGLFNGNVLIAEHGSIILRRAIGYADSSRNTPLKLDDRFHIGSVSKEFDAVGLLILAEQHKLALTDSVSAFFPDLPSWSKAVTVNDLLHYTSGLPDVNWKNVHSDADNWRDLHALQRLEFVPGKQYAYNNNNTFLRRKIIEKVAGISFKNFVETRELPAAGIHHGIVDPGENDTEIATSFDGNFKQDSLSAPISGWTALTVDDFFRWSECINSYCLISPASTREIVSTPDPSRQTGLGHVEMHGDHIETHVHDGSALHYQALIMFDAAKGRTIILLSNQKKDMVYKLSDAINAMLDDKPYKPAEL